MMFRQLVRRKETCSQSWALPVDASVPATIDRLSGRIKTLKHQLDTLRIAANRSVQQARRAPPNQQQQHQEQQQHQPDRQLQQHLDLLEATVARMEEILERSSGCGKDGDSSGHFLTENQLHEEGLNAWLSAPPICRDEGGKLVVN